MGEYKKNGKRKRWPRRHWKGLAATTAVVAGLLAWHDSGTRDGPPISNTPSQSAQGKSGAREAATLEGVAENCVFTTVDGTLHYEVKEDDIPREFSGPEALSEHADLNPDFDSNEVETLAACAPTPNNASTKIYGVAFMANGEAINLVNSHRNALLTDEARQRIENATPGDVIGGIPDWQNDDRFRHIPKHVTVGGERFSLR